MSRTLKDFKQNKELARARQSQPLKASYLRAKTTRSQLRMSEEDFCPDCGGLTDFQNGFLTCCECSWSTYETSDINFGFEFKTAA